MAAVRTGWWTRNTLPWVRRSAAFQLSVTPQLGVAAAAGPTAAAVGLAVTPTIGMGGAGVSVASFGLTVTPTLGVTTNRVAAAVELSVTPQISVTGVTNTRFPFTLPARLS